jgi:hypothetical protein
MDGCQARFGITAMGKTYYDSNVKTRLRVMPFIIWVNDYKLELKQAAMNENTRIEVGKRILIRDNEDSPTESCFVINLDTNAWSENGYCPDYKDWGEVWQYTKYAKDNYRIIWDQLPSLEAYTSKKENLEPGFVASPIDLCIGCVDFDLMLALSPSVERVQQFSIR